MAKLATLERKSGLALQTRRSGSPGGVAVSGEGMRKAALRRYVVFRVKAIEFLDLGGLHQGLLNGNVKRYPPFRTAANMADSLRTVQLSWLALFVDKNGTNVIELWQQVFPQHAKRVQEAWGENGASLANSAPIQGQRGFPCRQTTQIFLCQT